jgi:hypothetical protein
MKNKKETYLITTNFDNSGVYITWDGIKLQDAKNEVKFLAEKFNKSINDFKIEKV